MTTMLETLDETIAAYTSGTRAIQEGAGWCVYKTSEGQMCAVGRCMIDPAAAPHGSAKSLHAETLGGIDFLLKPEYRGYPIDFWSNLQGLHDSDGNWDPSGLSLAGQVRTQEIREEFCHDNDA